MLSLLTLQIYGAAFSDSAAFVNLRQFFSCGPSPVRARPALPVYRLFLSQSDKRTHDTFLLFFGTLRLFSCISVPVVDKPDLGA